MTYTGGGGFVSEYRQQIKHTKGYIQRYSFKNYGNSHKITNKLDCCCVMSRTCSDEEHVVGPLHALDLVHGDLCVAHAAFEQQGSAADHAVHQEMVLDKVEHFVRHVQGRLDTHLPGVVGHALRGSKLEMKNESLLIQVVLKIHSV